MQIKDLCDLPNVTISVTAADLKEFAMSLISEYNADRNEQAKDKRYNVDEACKYLNVGKSTLWRWAKEGYLKPDGKIGKKPYYLHSQLIKFGEANNGKE